METNFVIEHGHFDIQFNDITHLDVVDFFIQMEDKITYMINGNNV